MSKGVIKQNYGEGYYRVEITHYPTGISDLKTELTARITDLNEVQIPAAVIAKADALTARTTAQGVLDDAITAYNADPTENNKKLLRDAMVEANLKTRDYDNAGKQLTSLRASMASAQAEWDRANADTPVPFEVDIWCADFTDDIPVSTVVGVADLFSIDTEIPDYVIPPGYTATPAFSGTTHGRISKQHGQPPSGTFYNSAVFPWWARFNQPYMAGRLVSIDFINHTCTVRLIARDFTVFQAFGVTLPEEDVTDVPITYQNCHSAVFNANDLVLVQLIGFQKSAMTVVGFLMEPVDCQADGFLAYGLNRRRLTYSGNTWTAASAPTWVSGGTHYRLGSQGDYISYDSDPSMQWIRSYDSLPQTFKHNETSPWSQALAESENYDQWNGKYIYGAGYSPLTGKFYLASGPKYSHEVMIYQFTKGAVYSSFYHEKGGENPDGYVVVADFTLPSATHQYHHHIFNFNEDCTEVSTVVHRKPEPCAGTRAMVNHGSNDPGDTTAADNPEVGKTELWLAKLLVDEEVTPLVEPTEFEDLVYQQTITMEEGYPKRVKAVSGRHVVALDYRGASRIYAYLNCYETEKEWVSAFEEQAGSETGARAIEGERHIAHYSKYWISFTEMVTQYTFDDGIVTPVGALTRVQPAANDKPISIADVGRQIYIPDGNNKGYYLIVSVSLSNPAYVVLDVVLQAEAGVYVEVVSLEDDEITECILQEAQFFYKVESNTGLWGGDVSSPYGNVEQVMPGVIREELKQTYLDEKGVKQFPEYACYTRLSQLCLLDARTKTWVARTEEYEWEFLISDTHTQRENVLGEDITFVGYHMGVKIKNVAYHQDLYHLGSLHKVLNETAVMPTETTRGQLVDTELSTYPWFNNHPAKKIGAPWSLGVPEVCGLNSHTYDWTEPGGDDPINLFKITGFTKASHGSISHPNSIQLWTGGLGEAVYDPYLVNLKGMLTPQIVPVYPGQMGHQVPQDTIPLGTTYVDATMGVRPGMCWWVQDDEYQDAYNDGLTPHYMPAFQDNLTGYTTHMLPVLEGISKACLVDKDDFVFLSCLILDQNRTLLEDYVTYLQGAPNGGDPNSVTNNEESTFFKRYFLTLPAETLGGLCTIVGSSSVTFTGSAV
ncbi:MAG: hypothetical protein RPU34_12485 [Candidatus Sedimenticola sp. (ex Thyasira tokunagai)]